MSGPPGNAFTTVPLGPATWAGFAELVERHGGVWGGCWCMAFHPEGVGRGHTPEGNREAKECRVREGRAHAALVFDGDRCVGWCQFGPPDELPRIKSRRAYEQGLAGTGPADWRITCFFVDSGYRGRGVASAALGGALAEIAALGGGTVESFPEDAAGRRVSAGFLHNATLALFNQHGFTAVRRLGKHRWLVTRAVDPAAT